MSHLLHSSPFHAALPAAPPPSGFTAGWNEHRLLWAPVVAGLSGELLGFESLVPATPPQGKPRDWPLQTAVTAAARWAGGLVFARVATPWFAGPGLVATVAGALERSGLDAPRLQLTVDERTVNLAQEAVAYDLERLRALGVGIALDRFGAGAASLTALCALPLDRVRLAPSMIRNLGRCRRAEATVRSVLQLGASLGLHVCATGVEREDQLAILQAYNCGEVQGPLVAEPVENTDGLLASFQRQDRSHLFFSTGEARHWA